MHPEFPPEVERAAQAAARRPRLPDLDRTDIPFVTIDPEASMDLDQALHIERDGDGYVVHYAIADVAAFVTPGDPVDEEANRRGETLYAADSKIPLHPKVLSEGAASLLPDQDRPALLWTIKVDAEGEGTDVDVVRARGPQPGEARLRPASRRRSTPGRADELFVLLGEVGELPQEAGGRPRWSVAAAAGAGDRHRRRAVVAELPQDAAGRGVERPDLAADRDGGRVADGLRPRRPAAHAAAAGPARRAAAAPHRQGAAHRVARRAALPRLHPLARPREPQPRRDGRRLHPAAARVRLRRLQRRDPRAAGALRAGLGVRPRHRAAAPARRPVRRRGLRRAVRRDRGALLGARAARGAAQDAPGLGPPRPPVREGGARPRRGRRAPPARR